MHSFQFFNQGEEYKVNKKKSCCLKKETNNIKIHNIEKSKDTSCTAQKANSRVNKQKKEPHNFLYMT